MSLLETVDWWWEENLGVVGGVLAYVIEGIHLTHPKLGMPRWLLLAQADSPILLTSHPRPLVFDLTGIAIIIGVPVAATNHYRKPIYALGIALMFAYILGYLAWHPSGHGGFHPNRKPLYHGMAPLEALNHHFATDLLFILVALYRRES